MIATACSNAAIRRATRQMGQLYDAALRDSGLRATQYTILATIERYGSLGLGALAADLVMDRSALSHSLGPLIAQNLLRTMADPADGRGRRVTLTAKGTRTLEKARELWAVAEQKFGATLGLAAAAELRRQLDHIASLDFAQEFAKK